MIATGRQHESPLHVSQVPYLSRYFAVRPRGRLRSAGAGRIAGTAGTMGTAMQNAQRRAAQIQAADATISGGIVKSILDPKFRYTDSASTDLRKTFARVRREQRNAAKRPPMRVVDKWDDGDKGSGSTLLVTLPKAKGAK